MIITKTRPDVSTATALTMLAMLQECAEHLDENSDVDWNAEGVVHNEASRLLNRVEEVIKLAEGEIYCEEYPE